MKDLGMKMKRILGCCVPLYIYMGIGGTVCLVFAFLDVILKEYNVELISFADQKNMHTSLISGVICIGIFATQLRDKYGMRITDHLEKLNFKIIVKLFLWAIVIRLVMCIPLFILYSIDNNFGDSYELWVNGITVNSVSILDIGFIAPIVEEFMFRGLILHNLSQIMSDRRANILQTLIFALMHMNGLQIVTSMVFGYVQGKLVLKNKAMCLPIILHIMFNCMALLFF